MVEKKIRQFQSKIIVHIDSVEPMRVRSRRRTGGSARCRADSGQLLLDLAVTDGLRLRRLALLLEQLLFLTPLALAGEQQEQDEPANGEQVR